MTDRPRDDGGDPELEELLRSQPAPAGEDGFRASLRARFVAGKLGEADPKTVSLQRMDGRTAAVVIEDWLSQGQAPPPARESFVRELRRKFVEGDFEDSDGEWERAAPRVSPPRRANPALRVLVGGLAAAAAILAIGVFVPTGPRWTALAVQGSGPLIVDGERAETFDASLIGAALEGGGELGSVGHTIGFGFGPHLLLELRPGARIRAERAEDELIVQLLEGELYAKTDGAYDGPPLVVRTQDLDLRMVGTSLGVMTNGELTCVCVAHGAVELTTANGREACPASSYYQDWRNLGEVRAGTFTELLKVNPEAEGEHIDGLLEFTSSVGPLGF